MRSFVVFALLLPVAAAAQEAQAPDPALAADDAEAAPAEPAPPPEALVRVDAPKAAVDLAATPRELRLTATLHSDLPVAARAVELGVLFSAEEGLLASLDAGRAYTHVGEGGGAAVASGGAAALRRWVAATLPAHGQAQVELVLPLPEGAPDPLAFEVHVLSYELAQVEAPVLRALLATRAAADEAAVLRAFGLGAGSAAMRAAGERLAAPREGLLAAVADEALAAIPARPTQDETLMRVAWVLILGALGGDAASGALGTLALRPELEAFDEALQVVRAAALVGSPLEAPVGHALPREARKMAEVVAAARLGPEGLDQAGPQLAAGPAAAPAAAPDAADLGGPDDELDVLEPQPESREAVWLLLVVAAGLVVGWWVARRGVRPSR